MYLTTNMNILYDPRWSSICRKVKKKWDLGLILLRCLAINPITFKFHAWPIISWYFLPPPSKLHVNQNSLFFLQFERTGTNRSNSLVVINPDTIIWILIPSQYTRYSLKLKKNLIWSHLLVIDFLSFLLFFYQLFSGIESDYISTRWKKPWTGFTTRIIKFMRRRYEPQLLLLSSTATLPSWKLKTSSSLLESCHWKWISTCFH